MSTPGSDISPGKSPTGTAECKRLKIQCVFVLASEAIIGVTSARRGFEMLSYCLLCASVRIVSVILAAYQAYVLFDVLLTRREPMPDVIICSETCAAMSPNSAIKARELSGINNLISD